MDYIEKYDLQSHWPTQWPWSAIFRVTSHLKVSWLTWLWPYLTARPYRMSSSYDHHCQWWFKSINNERCILFSLSIDWDNQNIEIFLISQHKLWKVWLGDRWWVWHLVCGKCPHSPHSHRWDVNMLLTHWYFLTILSTLVYFSFQTRKGKRLNLRFSLTEIFLKWFKDKDCSTFSFLFYSHDQIYIKSSLCKNSSLW